MNSSKCLVILGLLLSLLSALTLAQKFENDGDLKCGYLFDGISRGRDLGRQKDSYPISANWEGFTHNADKNGQITYQFAIISQDRLTKTVLYSGPEAPTSKRCRYDDGLEGGEPDVVGWTTLTFDGKRSTKDSYGAFRIEDLDLKNHYRYYVILSAELGDEKIYTNSDGVYTTDRDNYDDDDDDDEEYLLLLLLLLLIPCCLLLLLLILLLVARGRGDDKYKTVVQRTG
jgi:hypothetical protein